MPFCPSIYPFRSLTPPSAPSFICSPHQYLFPDYTVPFPLHTCPLGKDTWDPSSAQTYGHDPVLKLKFRAPSWRKAHKPRGALLMTALKHSGTQKRMVLLCPQAVDASPRGPHGSVFLLHPPPSSPAPARSSSPPHSKGQPGSHSQPDAQIPAPWG